MQKSDGMNYAPVFSGKARRAVKEGEFAFSVCGLDHGHIFGMVNGLLEAGAKLCRVYDPDNEKVQDFVKSYPQAVPAQSEKDVLEDSSVSLIASAVKPCLRADFAVRTMKSGKHVFVDKPGFLTFEELESIRDTRDRTGKKFYIYFSERIHVEGSICAEELCRSGAVGKILNITILAPHRLNPKTRPDWFWEKKQNGSIIQDIGCHQIEQFLTFSGSRTAIVARSSMANWNNPEHENFYDYGDCYLVGDNGATCFFKVDWFTPDGMGAWGDGRLFITGTKGCIEVRKYLDVAQSPESDHVYFTDAEGEHLIKAKGKYGFDYFGKIIRDCIDGTDSAIDPEITFEAMKIAIEAAGQAIILH